jgi:hypothetical protein
MAELFNKVKQEIGKGISVVGLKSKEVLESMKIKKQIDTLQEQVELTVNELGHMVYPMIIHDTLDQAQLAEKCEIIASLYTQVEEKEAELNQLYLETGEALGKTYCSNCKSEILDGSKYCHQCGAKVTAQTEEVKE